MKSGFKAILLRKDEFLFCAILILSKNFYWSIVFLQCCVSAVKQSESAVCVYIHIHIYIHIYIYRLSFFGFPYHLCHHRALSRVPCALQQVLVSCLFYVQQYIYVNPNSSHSSPPHTILILNDSTCFILCCGESSFMIEFSLFTFCSGIPWGQEMKVLPFAHHLPTFASVDILQWGGLRYL